MAREIKPEERESMRRAAGGDAEDVRRYPPGLRHAVRWVRLCERQGTRLVDLVERWVEAAEEGNRQAKRLADVAERMAASGEAYLGTGYEEE
jgi:hypothetical protein